MQKCGGGGRTLGLGSPKIDPTTLPLRGYPQAARVTNHTVTIAEFACHVLYYTFLNGGLLGVFFLDDPWTF